MAPILGGESEGGGGNENEPVEKLRAVSDFAPIHTRVKRLVPLSSLDGIEAEVERLERKERAQR